MLVDVQRLRRDGLRLKSGEVEQAVRGILKVAQSDVVKHPLLTATLVDPVAYGGVHRDLLKSLFDVQLRAIDSGTILLSGYEMASDVELRVTEHRQIWRCAVVQEPAP